MAMGQVFLPDLWFFPDVVIPPWFSIFIYYSVSHWSLTVEAQVLTQVMSMWNLCWIKWQWDRSFSQIFGFSLMILFHHGSPYSYITQG
jgi:hypothetical protein